MHQAINILTTPALLRIAQVTDALKRSIYTAAVSVKRRRSVIDGYCRQCSGL